MDWQLVFTLVTVLLMVVFMIIAAITDYQVIKLSKDRRGSVSDADIAWKTRITTMSMLTALLLFVVMVFGNAYISIWRV